MKRALKIFFWTLFGLILTVVAAVCLVVYVVFTPQQMTPIARQAAAQYVTCEHEIGEVDLTFFSTFPRFGLRADGLLLINPKTGAPNDTVVEAKHLVATVDVMEFINHKNLHIHEAILEDATVHFYIAEDGTTNLTDVFVTSPDTTEDTTAFALPFEVLRVDGLRLQANAISFTDDKDTIAAMLGATELSAKADGWNDMLVTLDARDVCATIKHETYADSLHVELIAPMAMNLDSMHFAFDGARLAVNDFQVRVEGDVTIGDAIDVDAKLETGTWQIEPLLALVPKSFTSGLKDIDVAGGIKFEDGIALFPEVLDTHVPTPGKHCAVRHVHYKEPYGNAVARPAQDQNNFMMHPFVPLDGYELRTNPRDYCEIPYRSLVAVGVDNLLVAGRCYSAEFHALGATRVIATSMSMGQAAGHAAAACVQKQILPRELDGRELRAQLVAEGAHLNEPPKGYWETVRNTEGEFFVNTADTISIRSDKAPAFQ